MDIDAFAAAREGRWHRLEQLRKRRSLTGAESDELARLYQATATDLSVVRSSAPEPVLVSRLSTLVANTRTSLAGVRETAWKEAYGFLTYRFAAGLYRMRWATIAVMASFMGIAVTVGVHYTLNPELLDTLGSYEAREEYANYAFESYYSENPSTSFFARVWTNNSWIALVSVAGGITGFLPAWIQYENAVALGTAGAIMHEFDALDEFFQLITPHGLLELTAVWVAGGAGLRLFWVMLVPGKKSRLESLGAEGRSLAGTALGLVYVLLVSGLIEGFITGAPWLPWVAKDVIGVVALAGFWTYVWWAGRRAHQSGETGDVDSAQRADVAPAAA